MSIDLNKIKEDTSVNEISTSVVTIKPAKRPDELSEQQIIDIKKNADQAIVELVKVKGDIFADETNNIINIGIKDQIAVSNNMKLLQAKMGNTFYSDKKNRVTTDLSKDITELQDTLAKINPKDIQRNDRFKYISWIPFFGNRIIYALKQSINKGMTLKEFVDHLGESLAAGERLLREDNAELKVTNDILREKQKIVKADAYFAEVLMEKLSDKIKEVEDDQVKKNLNEVLFKISTRAQDLRAMENIHEQFFVALKMTRSNNDLLIDGARRMQSMGMTVVYTAMELQAASVNSKNALDMEVGTGNFIGKQLVANAQLIHSNVLAIGDFYKNPFVPMKMMEDSVAELGKAIDDMNKLKAEGIESAKSNIAKITIMTEEIKRKSGELPDTEVKSLEASKMLQ